MLDLKMFNSWGQQQGWGKGPLFFNFFLNRLLRNTVWFTDDRMAEYAPLSSSSRFLQSSWTTPVLYNEFLLWTTEDRRETDLLSISSSCWITLLEPQAPQQICAHMSDSAFPQGPEYWEMFSHYCTYVRTSEHVHVDISLVILQLPRVPTPSLPRLNKIRESKE